VVSAGPAIIRRVSGGSVWIGTATAPWGPVHVAACAQGLVGLAVLSPREPFVTDLVRRTGRAPAPGSTPLLDQAIAAVGTFLAGDPEPLAHVPVELVVGSDWDRAVLGAVRAVPWGTATSYGRVARAIGRRGAARAVGGAVGRNPIGLAIPCHRVLAGDGSLGGYGGDWFGSREELLEIKRELLALEGIGVPAWFPD
jgi:O-6-methylguanine DNA methyltransferase